MLNRIITATKSFSELIDHAYLSDSMTPFNLACIDYGLCFFVTILYTLV